MNGSQNPSSNQYSDDATSNYYETRAEEYAARTNHLSLKALYTPFLERIPAGGSILDAGCGPGRDAREFLNRGYQVTACDASARMVELARKKTGIQVVQLRFQDFNYVSQFDGIWACASLLHVPLQELDESLGRLQRALKPGGICFVSFKHGNGERIEDGKRFLDFTEDDLRHRLIGIHGFDVVEIWTTPDEQGRANVQWVNGLAKACA